MTAGRLVCLGDLVLDVGVRHDGQRQPATDTPARVHVQSGGSAANVAAWYVMATGGGSSDFIGCVGHDPAGAALVAHLRHSGVRPFVTRVRGGTTGCIVILVDDLGERHMLSDRGVGANLRLSARQRAAVTDCAALHLTLYSFVPSPTRLAAMTAAEMARAAGATLSLDLSSTSLIVQIGQWEVRRLIADVRPTIIFANTAELSHIIPPSDLTAPADFLGVPLVVSHNARGITVQMAGQPGIVVPAVPLPLTSVCDTTGAGDALAAGFLAGWLTIGLAEEAARMAVQLAAQAVQTAGARPPAFERKRDKRRVS